KNCTKPRVLHLMDKTAFGEIEEGCSGEDAKISRQGLEEMLNSLPNLEDLVLDVSHNVRDTGASLELECKQFRALKLGHFHEVWKGNLSLMGLPCVSSWLEMLSIKNCVDLGDTGPVAIATGWCKLKMQGCEQITEFGIKLCSSNLRNTMVNVSVSFYKYLDFVVTLMALEPIRDSVRKLQGYIDDDNVERFKVVGFSGSGSTSGQLLNSIEKQSLNCASWGSYLEL
ncbi:hypothetical protein KI387_040548, partial [Taxus chinensis]